MSDSKPTWVEQHKPGVERRLAAKAASRDSFALTGEVQAEPSRRIAALEARAQAATGLYEALRARCGLCVEAMQPTARVKPMHLLQDGCPEHRGIDDEDYGCELTPDEAAAIADYEAVKG